jgi:hypothetical protein
MRLVRRKLWRAFPELDGFDDALCRGFVSVANAGWRARVVRWTAMAGVVLPAVALAALGSALVADVRALRATLAVWTGLAAGLTAVAALLPGLILALVVRDALLRRSVRGVIRRSGGCQHCGYRLLGVPVGPDLNVRCPECGGLTAVDPALGELTRDGSGLAVFTPVAPRVDARAARRRRRVIRVTAISAASLATVLAVSYGVWTILVFRQAAAARADRDGAQRWRALTAQAQPIPGSGAGQIPAGAGFEDLAKLNRWAEAAEVLAEFDSRRLEFFKRRGGEFVLSSGQAIEAVDFTTVYEPPHPTLTPPTTPAAETAAADRKVAVRAAMAAIEELEASGFVGRLSGIRRMGVLMRPVSETASGPGEPLAPPLIDSLFPELGQARGAARVCAARMHLALRAGDQVAYIDALDTMLALARMCDAQCTLIERLVGAAIESLALSRVRREMEAYPTAEWTAAVRGVIAARMGRPPPSHAVRGEAVWARDAAAWLFAQPWKVQRATFGLEDEDKLGVSLFNPVRTPLGTYAGTARAMSGIASAWAPFLDAEPFVRPAAIPRATSELMLVQVLSPAYMRLASSEDTLLAQRRGVLTLLGIRHYRHRTGEVPERLEDLGDEDLPPDLATADPFTGQPFGYRRIDPAGDRAGRSFLLYSAGVVHPGLTPARTVLGTAPPAVGADAETPEEERLPDPGRVVNHAD